RVCEWHSCMKRPSYGPEGGPAVACSSHRLEHYVDVINVRCSYAGSCSKRAYFGGEDCGWRPTFCGSHRRASDVNVVVRASNHTQREISARYAHTGGRPERCSIHREEGMVPFPPTCTRTGCKRKAIFATNEGSTPTACSLHRKAGDIDLVRLTCVVQGCNLSASFGKLSKFHPLHCSLHRDYHERDLRHGCCSHTGCFRSPTYGSLFERPQRCACH
ncbi:hypothetical protein GUITHDRAFT_49063, partial [Guillardia theta CCMP2712]